MKPGNPADDGFLSDQEKKFDFGAVIFSVNNKTGKKFRTLMYGVCNSLFLPVVSKRVKTKDFCFTFLPGSLRA
jgi:hypothetical protein